MINETWAKSSYSVGQNNCVEVRGSRTQAQVDVRDSKDVSREHLAFGADTWTAFIEGMPVR